MIVVEQLTKEYPLRRGLRTALNNVSFTLKPGERLGIIGHNGSGKSTLIRLLAGVEPPTRGTVKRSMSVSWPLAFGGAFQGSLSGIDNIKFISRIYQVDFQKSLDYVRDFSELGKDLQEPVKTYSSGMLARLAFALTLAVDFDCLLIDEVIAVGDEKFQKKCREELLEKRAHKALVLVSHSRDLVKQYCHKAALLEKGVFTEMPNLDSAYQTYNQ
jgi:capsular polysaccharide transport system ATP-binding protein